MKKMKLYKNVLFIAVRYKLFVICLVLPLGLNTTINYSLLVLEFNGSQNHN